MWGTKRQARTRWLCGANAFAVVFADQENVTFPLLSCDVSLKKLCLGEGSAGMQVMSVFWAHTFCLSLICTCIEGWIVLLAFSMSALSHEDL